MQTIRTPKKYTVEQASEFVDTPCWIWQGFKDARGYGKTNWTLPGGKWSNHYVHKIMYVLLVGPIPDGHHLHHECRVPLCCNPSHLTPMASEEHAKLSRAGNKFKNRTHCSAGHEYTPENTTWYTERNGNPARRCNQCRANDYKRQRDKDPEKMREYRRKADKKRAQSPEWKAARALWAREYRAKQKQLQQPEQ